MGVRRAVEIALDAANRREPPIYTYGPLIHNPQVMSILAEKGISVIEKIPASGSGTVIIRAHGIPPQERKALVDAGFDVVDATCPRVIRVQSIISRNARDGFASIIIGDMEHPEIKGLLGYARGNGYVADSLESLEELPDFDRAIIVAQTTQNTAFFENVKQWAARRHPTYKVFNTICDSTEKRQNEVQLLARSVDAVVVVGGYNSGNTKRLAEIANQTGTPAVHIETAGNLDIEPLAGARHISITAGASTPNWIIKQVYQELEARLSKKEGRLRRWGFGLLRNLMLSNLYLALGAACLAYAGTRLQGIPFRFSYILIAALYTLSMHTVNHLLDRKSDRYNDPDRADFYQKNEMLLSVLAGVAGIGGLLVALEMGPFFFILLLCMSALGVVYNIDIGQTPLRRKRPPRLRDIPGSKTVLVALAWGIVASIFPAFGGIGRISGITVIVFVWLAALVFVRTAYFDITDMQGSRIVGKETIPIVLGEARTLKLLKGILVGMFLLLPVSAVFGIIALPGVLLSLCPLAMLVFLYAHDRGDFFPGLWRGFLMESHFVAAGLLTLLAAWLI